MHFAQYQTHRLRWGGWEMGTAGKQSDDWPYPHNGGSLAVHNGGSLAVHNGGSLAVPKYT